MTTERFVELAKEKVVEYIVSNVVEKGGYLVEPPKIFVVWYAKVLQNHKALLAVDDPNDRHYYEATYNGDKKQLYLDVYDKQENKCFEVDD
ncbi:DUF6275 family protein [Limosilactobacillus caviae]|uniref:DUF6275 family protein n=1 Tax=Limosilactobacillus caviae TaxID=1769424 RepID=UPI00129AD791|nr:DUF6275 family protein [Limosilactobacillus caviae]MCD7123670.1 DUF6275 family protein [Limosilactobacillus caviae]MRH47367.1 hypothetical protein [Limosilactobacillus reuteri]